MLSSLLAITALAAPAQGAPLPRAEIIQKLEIVPIFIVTSRTGQPLTATLSTRQKVLSAYMHPDEATAYLSAIKEKDAGLGNQLKVTTVNLASLYDAVNPQEGFAPYRVEYFPHAADAQAAIEMLKKEGTEVKGSIQAPIFMIRLKNGNYLSSTQNGQPFVPIFMAKADLDEFLASAIKAKPALKDQVDVELSNILKLFELFKTQSAAETRPFNLIPAKKSVEAAKRIAG